jgi:hypothetical protein
MDNELVKKLISRKANWLRENVSMPDFLSELYNLEPVYEFSGSYMYYCPFGHSDNNPSFAICMDPNHSYFNKFKCFSSECEESGDLLKFVRIYNPPAGIRDRPLSYKKAFQIIEGVLNNNRNIVGFTGDGNDLESGNKSADPENNDFFVKSVHRPDTRVLLNNFSNDLESGNKSADPENNDFFVKSVHRANVILIQKNVPDKTELYFQTLNSRIGHRVILETIKYYKEGYSPENVSRYFQALKVAKDDIKIPRELIGYFHFKNYRKLSARTIREFNLGLVARDYENTYIKYLSGMARNI